MSASGSTPGQLLAIDIGHDTEAGSYHNTASITVMDNELNEAAGSPARPSPSPMFCRLSC